MSIVDIVGGAVLLTLGRKIFWFFIAASGFYAGLELTTQYLHIKPEWVTWLIALGIGVAGALLAYFFQKLAIGAAGFLAGAFIASRLAPQLGSVVKGWEWLAILIGGILGIILMSIIFEWALTLLSSLAGAILTVNGLNLAGSVGVVVGVLLFAAGVVFQARLNRQAGSGTRKRSSTG